MSLREDLLGPYKAAAQRGIGPIEAAFYCVAWRLKQVGLVSRMDEETVTTAFLGGVTSAFPLCSIVFGSGGPQPVECSWGQFSKSTGTTANQDSEAYRGADFALVVWLTEELARVAIFQAKKMDVRGLRYALADINDSDDEDAQESSIPPIEQLALVPNGKVHLNVHRRPPQKGKPPEDWREAQMVRLIRMGREAIDAEQLRKDEEKSWLEIAKNFAQEKNFVRDNGATVLSQLNWIHYVGYLDNDAICIPLSSIPKKTLDKELRNDSFKVNAVEITNQTPGLRSFADLLIAGVKIDKSNFPPMDDDTPGWKLMHADVLQAILPELQSMMAVYMADERGTMGPDMRAEIESQATYGTYSQSECIAPIPDVTELEETLRNTRTPTPW